jgi:hypothetical protein
LSSIIASKLLFAYVFGRAVYMRASQN